MQLFAEVPAVVAPEYNHSVVDIGTFIEGIDYATYAGINEADRSQVALDGLAPLIVLDDFFMVFLGLGHFPANRGYIIKVVFVDIRQSYLVRGVHIEIFGRCVPGQMGAEEAAAEEKWFVVPFA